MKVVTKPTFHINIIALLNVKKIGNLMSDYESACRSGFAVVTYDNVYIYISGNTINSVEATACRLFVSCYQRLLLNFMLELQVCHILTSVY